MLKKRTRSVVYIGAVVYLIAASSAVSDGMGTPGASLQLQSELLRHSQLYDEGRAGREAIKRIREGVYDRYTADLCIDDISRCKSEVFQPFKSEENGLTSYSITISSEKWDSYPSEIQFEVVQEILFYSWGHSNRSYPPLFSETDRTSISPLDFLSPSSATMFATFGSPEYLRGGLGGSAYGPNCWYNSISAIADNRSRYANSKKLSSGPWDKPRFMGPSEFRCHMKQFTAVADPKFGDIVRYYVEDPIYNEKDNVYGGEIHAAVFVGEDHQSSGVTPDSRQIVLTKNGRSDLNFMIFQDVKGLDKVYLGGGDDGFGTAAVHGGMKQFVRVMDGGSLFDPATASDTPCYQAYRLDLKNYHDRWECLAGRLDPPPGQDKTCYDYPENWLTGKDKMAPPRTDLKLRIFKEPQELRSQSRKGSG
ncbi:hypothetical protein NKJ55_32790 [Mesorhizobium sp. M0106]|uniref:hypothetical protein n=1 Tax=Mesorhizobium sp. M0106 TaxID=2956880 RepID=UPI00333BB48A